MTSTLLLALTMMVGGCYTERHVYYLPPDKPIGSDLSSLAGDSAAPGERVLANAGVHSRPRPGLAPSAADCFGDDVAPVDLVSSGVRAERASCGDGASDASRAERATADDAGDSTTDAYHEARQMQLHVERRARWVPMTGRLRHRRTWTAVDWGDVRAH